jgi:hypothetical protein
MRLIARLLGWYLRRLLNFETLAFDPLAGQPSKERHG